MSAPTAETLFLLVLSMLAMESAGSIRSLYRHFLAGITSKSLNAFYYACSYAKVDLSGFMNATAKLALALVPDNLKSQPVFLCIDDTMVSKFGKKFEDISKLELAASMVRQVMPEFRDKKNVIILCDSWYVKQNLVSIVDDYENLDLIGNARSDSVIYDLPPAPTGRKGRPPKHGRRLSIYEDFSLSSEKIGDYFTGSRRVLTNIFGTRQVQAYVTAANKENGTRRLFFSTIFPAQLQIFCAWQEKSPLNRTGSDWMQYIPLFLYSFRWNIEVSYYEQKTFWSLCGYMVRSRKGIEMMVNLINISYCAMKLLPYKEETFSQYRNVSVQEFRFALSEQIRQQIFYVNLVKNIETYIKSNVIAETLKHLCLKQSSYL